MSADERISHRFWFEHQSGKRLYPYKLRDLRSGALTQVTRTNEAEQQARFGADGAVLWRAGNSWYRWTAGAWHYDSPPRRRTRRR